MAPPRKQVSPADSYQVYQYFRDNWRRKDRFLKDPDRARDPEKVLEKIGDGAWIDDEDAQAMQAWMDRYVTPEGVKRMWTAIRQRKYQLDKHPALVALDRGVHWRLKELSSRYRITLSDLVDRLLTEHEAAAGQVKSIEDVQVTESPVPHDPKGYRAYVGSLIRKLKDEDALNYREIADELNARQLKTFSGRSAWNQAMVSRIYRTAQSYHITKKTEVMNALARIMDSIRTRRGTMDGALVWIPDLRKEVEEALNCPSDVFDKAILELARKDDIILHRHVHVARITNQERREFVTDGENWFVGLALNV